MKTIPAPQRAPTDRTTQARDAVARTMNIGEASKASGVTPKMIRHYEATGLLETPPRGPNGYRRYADREVQTLRFIRHGRELGFSLAEIAQLVGLWHDEARTSRDVKALAQARIRTLDRKARDLLAMKSALEALVERCHGDGRPDCPIIESFADAHAADAPIVAGEPASTRRT